MNDLLKRVLETHGGLENWRSIEMVMPTLSFGGLAFKSKFNNKGKLSRRVQISTRYPMVTFEDFPKRGYLGKFSADKVSIESYDGRTMKSRESPRTCFSSFRHHFFWDDLDLLYFAGYACWNYFNSPFLLTYEGVETEEIQPWFENGTIWRRLAVSFPPHIPTHCKEQVFYFDNDYRMVRLDYYPEIFAKWAKAAHYCHNFQKFGQILIPLQRTVVPNSESGRLKKLPILVWIEVTDITFESPAGEIAS